MHHRTYGHLHGTHWKPTATACLVWTKGFEELIVEQTSWQAHRFETMPPALHIHSLQVLPATSSSAFSREQGGQRVTHRLSSKSRTPTNTTEQSLYCNNNNHNNQQQLYQCHQLRLQLTVNWWPCAVISHGFNDWLSANDHHCDKDSVWIEDSFVKQSIKKN